MEATVLTSEAVPVPARGARVLAPNRVVVLRYDSLSAGDANGRPLREWL
jgi:hypothetical protein